MEQEATAIAEALVMPDAISPLKVLLIEDNAIDARLIQIMLSEAGGGSFDLERADRLAGGLKRLAQGDIGLVLLDLSLPDSKGLINFKKLVKSFSTPVIIYTGLTDEFIKSEAMTFGAMDYLVKGKTNDDTLKESIVNSIIQYSLDKQK